MVFKSIVKNPNEYKKFELDQTTGALYLKQNSRRLLCIPDITVGDRKMREIVISEAHVILAHLGFKKTNEYLCDYVWWKSLYSDIEKFCDTCVMCKQCKDNSSKPYGLLNQLEVHPLPWDRIGIDFVGPLPFSHDHWLKTSMTAKSL
jgi:hypothetical protein